MICGLLITHQPPVIMTTMERPMDDKDENISERIDGLKPLNPNAMKEFQRVMTEEVIPEIVRVVEERRLAAAESRHWQLKC